MSDLLAENLTGGVRRASDGNGYEFGFNYGGVFVPVAYVKSGGLEADLQEAKQRQADLQAQQQQQPQG
jgi:hypothetical protein